MLLDTNILIYFLEKKDPNAAQYFRVPHVSVSVLTRTELLSGVSAADRQGFLNFLDRLHCIPISSDVADRAALLIRDHHSFKKRLPDALIAATCLLLGHELVTANVKDFQGVPHLKIIPFQPR